MAFTEFLAEPDETARLRSEVAVLRLELTAVLARNRLLGRLARQQNDALLTLIRHMPHTEKPSACTEGPISTPDPAS